jgi:hypothetical protein
MLSLTTRMLFKEEIMCRSKMSLVSLLLVCLASLCSTASGQVVSSPEDVLGFKVGEDYHLATYTQAIAYFKSLEKSSDRIRLFDMGKTSMGQTMTYAVISSPHNLKNLETYKEIARKLTSVKGLDEDSAKNLAKEGKAIVYIDGGLHASECAPAQHNIQLAYNMVTAQDPHTLDILEDVILILVFANPDGMNLLADWYHPNVGTPYEISSMPWLYHVYSGHDNNRDSYICNLVETQNITKLVTKEYHPVILYNHHQTAPFPARIWIPPNSEPTNPNVHPLIVRWQNLIGSAMGAAFDKKGKDGAISRIVFDTWFPGYVTQVVDSHNIISILTETALYRYATPHFYTIRDFPEEYRDLTMSAFYPSPWKGGWWRLEDAVDYCLTASMAVLDVAAKYKEELLYNKFKMGADVIQRFAKEPPYAWIIPKKQDDAGNASLLLNRMILLGINIYQNTEPFSCDGIDYPPGTFIIPMSQPFALFIKNLFEEQRYPDMRKYPDLWQGLVSPMEFEGAPFGSFDQMGWTLPYQFGVRVHAANTPINPEMNPVREARFQQGGISGNAAYAYLLRHEENNSFKAVNRILESGGEVLRSKTSFIIPSRSVPSSLMQNLAAQMDLKIEGISKKPGVEMMNVKRVRLGLYKSWVPSTDEGWTRFIFEKFEFPFTQVHDADIRAGNLDQKYDAIIFPSTRRPASIVEGHAKGTMPPKYVGGITTNGVRNLKSFAKSGGTLIFLNASCNFAVEFFDIPVKNNLTQVDREKFVCDGSILRMEFNTAHPIAYGMPKEAATIFDSSCAFTVMPSFDDLEAKSIAKYPGENPLMSGWIFGDSLIRNKSAVVEVPYGEGKIILLGFPVQFRSQPYGTFKLLFNAIFFAGI